MDFVLESVAATTRAFRRRGRKGGGAGGRRMDQKTTACTTRASKHVSLVFGERDGCCCAWSKGQSAGRRARNLGG